MCVAGHVLVCVLVTRLCVWLVTCKCVCVWLVTCKCVCVAGHMFVCVWLMPVCVAGHMLVCVCG